MKGLDIIRTWADRKVSALTTKKDEDVVAVKVTDSNYATLRTLKKTNDKCENLIRLGEFVFSDSIKERVAEIKKEYRNAVKEVETTSERAIARLELADDYKDTVKILKEFGILNRSGKINA